MSLLFIDLETNGIPDTKAYNDYYSPDQLKRYNSSRIIQIAIIVYKKINSNSSNSVSSGSSSSGLANSANLAGYKLHKIHNYYIKPDNFKIYNHEIHKITQSIAEKRGQPFKEVVGLIENDLREMDLMIAHNILFDKNVLLSELLRYGFNNLVDVIVKKQTFCTSMHGCNITKIKMKNGKFKQPKMSELYKFLLNKPLQNLHDALSDTTNLAELFFELIAKNYVEIKT